MNYKIIIEKNSFVNEINKIQPKLIIADSNVTVPAVDYPIEKLATSEKSKDFEFYFKVLNLLNQYNLNRNETVVIVGGGVLIDVASFAASTFKRGINYVNVPTTTLSMIDSSVGSKNGLNYNGVKNLIGNITDPSKVIIDIDFLKTLDERNINNGIAEAIKIGYLSNPTIISELNKSNIDIEQIIKLSVNEKLEYVKKDKQDMGYRNYLNFGHTFGHAIESVTDFSVYYHGEAVSIGMVIASGYDSALIELLEKFSLPTKLPQSIEAHQLIKLMKGDKKNTSEKIKVVLKNPTKQIVELTEEQVSQLFKLSITVPNTVQAKKITVNKSKSHIHRLLASALATKSKVSFEFNIENDLSDDVAQSINIVKNSGGQISMVDGQLICNCQSLVKPTRPYYIYKSATTYRIFTPILCALFGSVDIELDEQLASRPHPVFAPFIDGITHTLPFDLEFYKVSGAISSQFISGYILAAVATGEVTNVIITDQITSTPYIDMTINVIKEFGCLVRREGNIITIGVNQPPVDIQTSAEPDFSSLAYFVVYNKLAEINGTCDQIAIDQFNGNSLQADSVIYDLLDNQVVDMKDCPDLLPTLVVYGLLNKRGITLVNVDRIKFKECDRIAAMIENYKDLNAIQLVGNELVISPVSEVSGRIINSYGDHRIAMAASIIAPFCTGPIVIDDYTVVNKSFPTFFKQLLGENNECTK